MDGVAHTGLLVAALRAREQERADRLFTDPFAHALATDAGDEAMRAYYVAAGPGIPIVEVRTRWYDEALARATESGIRQVVLLAAGMDARAYRLAWPEGTRLFELDQPDVIAHKARVLASASPTCERIARAVDLRADWPSVLREAGFDAAASTVWMIEGLLQYLPEAAARAVTERIEGLSSPGSIALYDVVGAALLAAPFMKGALGWMAANGSPWVFGTDEPASLFPAWDATVTDPAAYGNALGRWPFPAAPANVPGIPRGYLVEARRG